MKLINIALHQIIREDNNVPELNLSNSLLDIESRIVIEFVEKIIKSFGAKHPTYGQFQDDKTTYPFQTLVEKYRKNGDFLGFSTQAMKLLEKEIQVPQAKGGYVVLVHYSQNSIHFLITIMLDKAERFTIDDASLDIKKLETLDIDKLARANRINFKKWESDEETYLAFIKGTRDVSGYFQKFIGNTDLTSSKVNSRNLNRAVLQYMREKNFTDDKKAETRTTISSYFNSQYEKEEDIDLTAISAFLNPENPKDFSNFISQNEELQVSGSFRVTAKADFRMFHRALIKGSGYNIEFERNLIREGRVKRKGNNLIFCDLPEEDLNKEFN